MSEMDISSYLTLDRLASDIHKYCKNVLGYDPDELMGSEDWIIHPDDSERGKKAYSKALEGESGLGLEYRVITKQGDIKHILTDTYTTTSAYTRCLQPRRGRKL